MENKNFHDKYYKHLLIIPIILLLASATYMFIFYSNNNDFIYRDISLTGGTTVTIYEQISPQKISQDLSSKLENLNVRVISDLVTREQKALIIETRSNAETTKQILEEYLGYELNQENSSFEFTGSALSESFFRQLLIAILFAFIFMAIVVFIIFRSAIPSLTVIIAAFLDIFMTLTIVNIFGIQMSSAGIVAFLMLIGYSVDTNILLTTRIIKRKEGELNKRFIGAFKTGITMTLTSLVAVIFALFIVKSFSIVLTQIFTILAIGLCFDIFNTWITNVSILKLYMEKKKMKIHWKIWLLIIVLAFSLISIFGLPPTVLEKGAVITSVDPNSTAFEQGLREGQIITAIDGVEITNIFDFTNALEGKYLTGQKIKTTITTNNAEVVLFSNNTPEITVSEIPKTNIKTGLDLAGGSRALVKAQEKDLSKKELNDLVDITNNRLNEFGLTDLNIRAVSDLQGNNFMLIEIAGATPEDLEELISKQGKFEAKIGNETVFIGGDKDIASVARGGQDAGIFSCDQTQGGYFCNFRFTIFLSEAAANRHADITKDLEVNATSGGQYLSEKLDLFLDDKLVDSLLISEGLKGRVTTQISISGSGQGGSREEAYNDAETQMHKLQTVLITGSLPFKLEIVKLDTISPVLGKEFIRSIFLAGAVSLFAVSIIIFVRYKKFKSSIALLITSISEVIIILGIASFIEWNLDLPSIAGILATIGTGIDQQIIILDEAKQSKYLSIKQRLKRAFTIILGAYFTALVALLPLLWAGAGLLKGFAVTTIIGITAGVLITRPAFTEMIKRIED